MNHACPCPEFDEHQQREVTLLFADMRGFTELSASLETDPLFCELVSHVLDCLTEAVVEYNGFVIDYYGDGLAAMWNAPSDQPEHAELACRAALQMIAALPAVAAEWNRLIHTSLRLGIGVHTAAVQVGNAGSSQRIKYGARGPHVHLASRVESATKELRVPLLATQATVERIPNTLSSYRVCRVLLPGWQQPVELFAVSSRECNEPSTAEAWKIYARALYHFEHGQFQKAADALATISAEHAEVPARFLMERARQELGRSLRRRSTDKPAIGEGGLITLTTKRS